MAKMNSRGDRGGIQSGPESFRGVEVSNERGTGTYLRDILAGAMHAIELLKAMRGHHSGEPLGLFAAESWLKLRRTARYLQRWPKRRAPLPAG